MSGHTIQHERDFQPPNPPWKALELADPPLGCLSFHYADDLARLPVRAVTLFENNKSDPNLETATYGLFSTCERQMRSSVVTRGISYIFFTPRWKGERVVTGYYKPGWFVDLSKGEAPDYALAASAMRFVDPPIRLAKLPAASRKETERWFRTYRLLSAKATTELAKILNAKPDRTADYLEEIDRLERFNLFHSGFRIWDRKEAFDWNAAAEYLKARAGKGASGAAAKNTSATGHWFCMQCGAVLRHKVLLRKCRICGAMGTLKPATDAQIREARSA